MDNHVKAAMEWSKAEQKVEVFTLSAGEKAAWNAKLAGLTAKWVDEAKAKGLPAEQIVADIKALVAKHSK
jgi:hypothetical protein